MKVQAKGPTRSVLNLIPHNRTTVDKKESDQNHIPQE
jgi:hypothetical protein